MTNPTIHIAHLVTDQVPPNLPVTCLYKDKENSNWVLKTANENGVRETIFRTTDHSDEETVTKAVEAYFGLPIFATGHLVIIVDTLGSDARTQWLVEILKKCTPKETQLVHLTEVMFPITAKPKR